MTPATLLEEAPVGVDATRVPRSSFRPLFAAGISLGLLIAVVVLVTAPWMREPVARLRASLAGAPENGTDEERVVEEIARASRDLERLKPRGAYLVVNTTENRMRLMGPKGVLHEGLCSTGSNVELRGTDGRTWLFKTPRGVFRVLKKTRNPVWTKPDWAFVEEGKPIPPLGSPERIERGVLGAYSLSIGDGYLIHGTLYQRMLGQPVSHGCIRLGDEELEQVYRALGVGSRVYIY